MSISILLADDQALVRTGFRMMLQTTPDLRVIGEAADGSQAVSLVTRDQPDVVLMDVRMPGLDGIDATRRIAQSTRSRVLILTTFDLDEYAFEGIRAGASGFLLKDVPPADLLSAVRAVAGGDAVVAPSVTRRLIDAFAVHLPDLRDPEPDAAGGLLGRLTGREREVLLEVARGHSNQEIARDLVVSEATVKTHVGRLLTKLGARDRVQLVVLAYEAGVVRRGGG
jgi:DNA-binding NarL/FixJ family response regulator